jgi:hypothetical protein
MTSAATRMDISGETGRMLLTRQCENLTSALFHFPRQKHADFTDGTLAIDMTLTILPIKDLPLIHAGDDLPALIAGRIAELKKMAKEIQGVIDTFESG